MDLYGANMAITYDIMKDAARMLYERAIKRIPENSKLALGQALTTETARSH